MVSPNTSSFFSTTPVYLSLRELHQVWPESNQGDMLKPQCVVGDSSTVGKGSKYLKSWIEWLEMEADVRYAGDYAAI